MRQNGSYEEAHKSKKKEASSLPQVCYISATAACFFGFRKSRPKALLAAHGFSSEAERGRGRPYGGRRRPLAESGTFSRFASVLLQMVGLLLGVSSLFLLEFLEFFVLLLGSLGCDFGFWDFDDFDS